MSRVLEQYLVSDYQISSICFWMSFVGLQKNNLVMLLIEASFYHLPLYRVSDDWKSTSMYFPLPGDSSQKAEKTQGEERDPQINDRPHYRAIVSYLLKTQLVKLDFNS